MRHFRKLPHVLAAAGVLIHAPLASGQTLPRIPQDLLQDEHIREEFGVNQFTTPSIRKLFGSLDELGALPYEKIKRDLPETAPHDRTLLALGLGGLIADGFLVVQAQKFSDFENIGRAVVKYAKVLGAEANVTRHVKSALELGTGGEWDKLREELARTQADVEAEMVQLRDVGVAHLIALGGYLRAVEIICVASLEPFDAKKSKALRRADVIDYFLQELSTLEPRLQELEHIQEISKGVEELRAIIGDGPDDKSFTKEEVENMHRTAAKLVKLSSTSK